MGEIRGCSCARKVIAHMRYIATADSTSVDRHTLRILSASVQNKCEIGRSAVFGSLGISMRGRTYV
jgi:hypothetical protein